MQTSSSIKASYLNHRPWRYVDNDEIHQIQAKLANEGCAIVPTFIHDSWLSQLQSESEALEAEAYHTEDDVNIYTTKPEPGLSPKDPRSRLFTKRNSFVPRDKIPQSTIIAKLHQDREFQNLIARCFGLSKVFAYADPYAGLVLNVLRPGKDHFWHFDTNEYSVTLLTKQPDGGGQFEYVPEIRNEHNENFDEVNKVLDGQRERVRSINLQLGDLHLFKGRFSLHRVCPVQGRQSRITAILCFTRQPNVIGKADRSRFLFGRVSSLHQEENTNQRADSLID